MPVSANLVKALQDRLLDSIKEILCNSWVEFNEQNTQQQIEHALLAKPHVDKWNLRWNIEQPLKNEFRTNFNKSHPALYQQLITQIKQLPLEQILSTALTEHPWFEDELKNLDADYYYKYKLDKSLACKFAVYFLSEQLELLRSKGTPPNWETLMLSVNQGTFNFPKIDLSNLAQKAQGFPNAQYEDCFITNKPELYRLGSTYSYDDDSHVINHCISRTDLYNYLYRLSNQHLRTITLEGVETPRIAPLHYTELDKLNQSQVNYLDLLIVNINTESSTLWVVLHQPNPSNWVAYLTKEEALGANQILRNFSKKNNLDITYFYVDYSLNIQRSNLPELYGHTLWHAVLLGRVIPFCLDGTHKDLSLYRSTIPISLLLEFSLKQCCNANRKFSEGLCNRSPFSDSKIHELINKYSSYDSDKQGGDDKENESKFKYLLQKPKFFRDKTGLYLENDIAINNQLQNNIIRSFDNNQLAIKKLGSSQTHNILIISQWGNEEALKHAIYLLYHNTDLAILNMPSIIIEPGEVGPILVNLFDYNTSILTVTPYPETDLKNSSTYFPKAMSCAARNRFLHSAIDPDKFHLIEKNVRLRRELWTRAGSEITQFFARKTEQFNIDLYERYKELNATWSQEYYNHTQKPQEGNDLLLWDIAQIAQMGSNGIDSLFNSIQKEYINVWNNVNKSPSLNLSCIFDLNGSLNEEARTYTDTLARNIQLVLNNNKGCGPIFKNLSFLLPEQPNTVQEPLIEIFSILNKQISPKPDQGNSIILYNLNIKQKDDCESLLNKLESLANQKDNPLTVLPIIPAWDRACFTDQEDCGLKAKYRRLQNAVLNNQRLAKNPELTKALEPLYLCQQDKIDPQVLINDHSQLKEQSFVGEDIAWPLDTRTNQSLGIQQQLQQVQQEEQEQEQEQEDMSERVYEISQYQKDLGLLITRDNIDERCSKEWALIPEGIKNLSGATGESLAELFSLWVGSYCDAGQVITKIEPQAITQLMRHARFLKLGLSRDNLPPGFSLSYSDKKDGLILCYNKQRKKEDLIARNSLPLDKINPFTVLFHQRKRKRTFHGDYREFIALSEELTTSEKKLLWTYLAQEDADQIRIDNTAQVLDELKITHTTQNASVQLQHFTVEGQVQAEAEPAINNCLQLLQNKLSSKYPKQITVINHLFAADSPLCMTASNLKAFGQLFYEFEAANLPQNNKNGIEQFIHLAQSILDYFGEEALSIWKNRLLNPSQHLSECLDRDEVIAIALSIATLKNPEAECYRKVWWKLIDAHGKALGHMKYAALWYGFQKVIRLIENDRLILNEEALVNYLSTVTLFNGQVFLDRLFCTLNSNHNNNLPREINQNILNCVDKIDWRHNGFYYAVRYEQYDFWDNALQLSSFEFSAEQSNPGYLPKMAIDDQTGFAHFKVQALRFAHQKLHLNPEELTTFKEIIDTNFATLEEPRAQLVLRLFVACITLGSDRVMKTDRKQLNQVIKSLNESDINDLKLINQAFNLDVMSASFALTFAQIPLVIAAASNSTRNQELSDLPFIKSCINALTCYASSYIQDTILKKTKEKAPLALLTRTLKAVDEKEAVQNFYFKATPWVYIETQKPELINTNQSAYYYKDYKILSKQLRTIQFDQSTFLPSYESIRTCLTRLTTTNYHNFQLIRTNWIKDIQNQGCVLKLEQTIFRALNEEEFNLSLKQITPHLEDNFKKETTEQLRSFFLNYLAVESQGTNQDQELTGLIKRLIGIDNKAHYNDLGQVIGLLIEFAQVKTGAEARRYSCKQLTQWLSMISKGHIAKDHYPSNVLKEILAFETRKINSSLLNSNLNLLKPNTENKDLKYIEHIIDSKIPSHFKGVLTKLCLTFTPQRYLDKSAIIDMATESFVLLEKANAGKAWLKAVEELLNQAVQNGWRNTTELLEIASMTAAGRIKGADQPAVRQLWQESRIKLIKWICAAKGEIDQGYLSIIRKNNYYTILIFLKANEHIDLTQEPDYEKLNPILYKLRDLKSDILESLVSYYAHNGSVPSFDQLSQCMQHTSNTDEIIDHFETIIQATQPNGQSKRSYSISADENKGLIRVLSGFKRKGQGSLAEEDRKNLLNLLYYCNHYSQIDKLSTVSFKGLRDLLKQNLNGLRVSLLIGSEFYLVTGSQLPLNEDKKQFSSTQMLACLREVLLRKTGKWANHTQMLDLIYAAINDEDNLLHQVKTGQGKSIITLMRASYLALTGNLVDVFSAKDSLSKRDHQEYSHVLDALGISNAHITSDSPAALYKLRSTDNGVGAVNFATIGNFSLFQSRLAWQHEAHMDLKAKKRVAFIDEGDHILQDEDTQFNYSDNDASTGLYNYDDWVYRLAYDFYLDHKSSFVNQENGISTIHRNTHLKALCELIQSQSILAPKQSTFVKRYITPALGMNQEALDKRDNALKQLIIAAHMAQALQQDINFCTRPVQRTMANGTSLQTRFAKVIIDNQIKDGSTYSDLVQQFLHVRLNKEAIAKGEVPNYFVEPNSQITLSGNAKYILNHFFSKIEGCTGTAGEERDLAEYQKTYNITHVVKLPTHEIRATEFLGVVFCDDKEKQITQLTDCIINNPHRPLLITCVDDTEVKNLANLIKAKLQQTKPDYPLEHLIVDTNDSGKSENDIVPLSGIAGRVTLSARMGRGTDIKPESEAGLMVLRTYPTISRISKQEIGRQGRNGAKGSCQEIIDYSAISAEYVLLQKSPDKGRLTELLDLYRKRTQAKLASVKDSQSTKWTWLTQAKDAPERYSISQAVAQLKHEQKKQNERFLRRKEYLLAALSGEVLQLLQTNFDDPYFNKNELQESWMDCRKRIEAAWATRLAGQACDSEEVYQAFALRANEAKYLLAARFIELSDPLDLQSKSKKISKERIHEPESNNILVTHAPYQKEFAAVVSCYQKWIEGAQEHLFSASYPKKSLIEALYGTEKEGLNNLFTALYLASCSTQDLDNRTLLFSTLAKLPKPQLYLFASSDLAQTIKILADNIKHKDFKCHLQCLTAFFNAEYFKGINPKKSEPSDVHKRGLLLQLCMKIIVCKVVKRQKLSEQFLTCLCEQIINNHWDKLDEHFVEVVCSVFAANPNATEALTNPIYEDDLTYFIKLLLDNAAYKPITEIRNLSQKRVNTMVKYLEENSAQVVRDGQSIVRPLFNLILGSPSIEKVDNYLPEPDFLGPMSFTALGKIWAFIAKRQPVEESGIKRLQKLLKVYRINQEREESIIYPLTDLPLNLSIPYIVNALEYTKSQTNIYEYQAKIAELNNAGTQLNQFLLQANLIPSDKTYVSPSKENKALLDSFIKLFNQQTPAQNITLFSKLTQNIDLGPKLLMQLAPKFINKELDEKSLQLFADINSLMGKESQMQDDLRTDIINGCSHAPYREFIEIVKKKGLKPQELSQLWAARHQNIIANAVELKHYLKVFNQAVSLQKNKNWADYFADFGTNKAKRVDIMKLISQNIIRFDQGFTKACYANYGKLASQCIKTPDRPLSRDGTLTINAKKLELISRFRRVSSFCKELKMVHEAAIVPSQQTPETMQAFFSAKKEEYRKEWWKNTTRKQQAHSLFSNLKKISKAPNENYYEQVLDAVWETQQSILTSDKNTKVNAKGYSRLYDITIQMTIEIARQCLSNETLTPSYKAMLSERMDRQRDLSIKTLAERLPEGHQYKQLLATYSQQPMENGSVNNAWFERNVQSIRSEQVPKHLRYLVTNIQCFLALGDEVQGQGIHATHKKN